MARFNVELARSKDSSDPWVVVLTVTIAAPDDVPAPPYTVDVRAIGHFWWGGQEAEESDLPVERTIGVNGASLLYSGLRELIGMISARGPWGPMLLPTVDFRAIKIDITDMDQDAEHEPKPSVAEYDDPAEAEEEASGE